MVTSLLVFVELDMELDGAELITNSSTVHKLDKNGT